MHRDQAYGGLILIVSVIIIIVFNLWIWDLWVFAGYSVWAVRITVWLLVMLVLGIAAWIGYTMAATPPPRPIEDLTPPPKPSGNTKPAAERVEGKPEGKEKEHGSKTEETRKK